MIMNVKYSGIHDNGKNINITWNSKTHYRYRSAQDNCLLGFYSFIYLFIWLKKSTIKVNDWVEASNILSNGCDQGGTPSTRHINNHVNEIKLYNKILYNLKPTVNLF